MARINKHLLDSEAHDYLEVMNVETVSGVLLDEIVEDYVTYIDRDYPTFGQKMNEKYHFNDEDLPHLPYSQAYRKIQNEYVQKDW